MHKLPSTPCSCWHIWGPHPEAERAHIITMLRKWKVQPPTLELSPAQPFPEEWEAGRQLQLGRNTHDPSQHHLLISFFQRELQRQIPPVQTWVSWQSLHTQIHPFQLPYPRVWQKREDPKICKKPSAEGTTIPRIWEQRLLNQGSPTWPKMCAMPI